MSNNFSQNGPQKCELPYKLVLTKSLIQKKVTEGTLSITLFLTRTIGKNTLLI